MLLFLDQGVIAGYHWFNDWGRDTLIALPGLTLVTGRFKLAKGLLETFGQILSSWAYTQRVSRC